MRASNLVGQEGTAYFHEGKLDYSPKSDRHHKDGHRSHSHRHKKKIYDENGRRIERSPKSHREKSPRGKERTASKSHENLISSRVFPVAVEASRTVIRKMHDETTQLHDSASEFTEALILKEISLENNTQGRKDNTAKDLKLVSVFGKSVLDHEWRNSGNVVNMMLSITNGGSASSSMVAVNNFVSPRNQSVASIDNLSAISFANLRNLPKEDRFTNRAMSLGSGAVVVQFQSPIKWLSALNLWRLIALTDCDHHGIGSGKRHSVAPNIFDSKTDNYAKNLISGVDAPPSSKQIEADRDAGVNKNFYNELKGEVFYTRRTLLMVKDELEKNGQMADFPAAELAARLKAKHEENLRNEGLLDDNKNKTAANSNGQSATESDNTKASDRRSIFLKLVDKNFRAKIFPRTNYEIERSVSDLATFTHSGCNVCLLSALSALSPFPQLFTNVFSRCDLDMADESTIFALRLFLPDDDFLPGEVLVNDRIPCFAMRETVNENSTKNSKNSSEAKKEHWAHWKPCFGRYDPKAYIFPYLLEKGLAKLFGSYSMLNGINTCLIWALISGVTSFGSYFPWTTKRSDEIDDIWGEGKYGSFTAESNFAESNFWDVSANAIPETEIYRSLKLLLTERHIVACQFRTKSHGVDDVNSEENTESLKPWAIAYQSYAILDLIEVFVDDLPIETKSHSQHVNLRTPGMQTGLGTTSLLARRGQGNNVFDKNDKSSDKSLGDHTDHKHPSEADATDKFLLSCMGMNPELFEFLDDFAEKEGCSQSRAQLFNKHNKKKKETINYEIKNGAMESVVDKRRMRAFVKVRNPYYRWFTTDTTSSNTPRDMSRQSVNDKHDKHDRTAVWVPWSDFRSMVYSILFSEFPVFAGERAKINEVAFNEADNTTKVLVPGSKTYHFAHGSHEVANGPNNSVFNPNRSMMSMASTQPDVLSTSILGRHGLSKAGDREHFGSMSRFGDRDETFASNPAIYSPLGSNRQRSTSANNLRNNNRGTNNPYSTGFQNNTFQNVQDSTPKSMLFDQARANLDNNSRFTTNPAQKAVGSNAEVMSLDERNPNGHYVRAGVSNRDVSPRGHPYGNGSAKNSPSYDRKPKSNSPSRRGYDETGIINMDDMDRKRQRTEDNISPTNLGGIKQHKEFVYKKPPGAAPLPHAAFQKQLDQFSNIVSDGRAAASSNNPFEGNVDITNNNNSSAAVIMSAGVTAIGNAQAGSFNASLFARQLPGWMQQALSRTKNNLMSALHESACRSKRIKNGRIAPAGHNSVSSPKKGGYDAGNVNGSVTKAELFSSLRKNVMAVGNRSVVGLDQLRFESIVSKWNPELSVEQLELMWQCCDQDGDEVLDWNEFNQVF